MMIGQPTPEQFEQLEAKNVAVTAHQQAVSKISPAKLLQNALHALGVAVGDSKLSSLAVDGKIGPKTVTATNYAFAAYLNAPNKMSQAYVQQHVNYLQGEVTKYVEAHGGVVNLPLPKVKSSIIPGLPSIPLPAIPLPGSSGFTFPRWGWWVIGGVSGLVLLNALALGRRRSPPPRPRRRRSEEAAAEA